MPTLPILMLTARREDMDRIMGLEMGADDYLDQALRAARALRPHPRGAAPQPRPAAQPGRRRPARQRAPACASRGWHLDTDQPPPGRCRWHGAVALSGAEYRLLAVFLVASAEGAVARPAAWN
jgi:two-component system OmpR family response regulator